MFAEERFLVVNLPDGKSHFFRHDEKVPVLDYTDFTIEKCSCGELLALDKKHPWKNGVDNEIWASGRTVIGLNGMSLTPYDEGLSQSVKKGTLIGKVSLYGQTRYIHYLDTQLGVTVHGNWAEDSRSYLGFITRVTEGGHFKVVEGKRNKLFEFDACSIFDNKVPRLRQQIAYAYKENNNFIVVSTITFKVLIRNNRIKVMQCYDLINETLRGFYVEYSSTDDIEITNMQYNKAYWMPQLAKNWTIRGY